MITLILPYFGKFPNYFPVFMRSCSYNKGVSWLVYTDCDIPSSYPSNIRFIRTSFANFAQRFRDFFDFEISLENPYKLCDYKVSYGEVLQKDLAGSDYWGHCDCDLVFGDFTQFVTAEVLSKYNKIFTRGHLTIYHNDPETNSFYRNIKHIDYKIIYQNPRSFAFDEWPGVSRVWKEIGLPYYDELCFDDIQVGHHVFYPTKRDGSANGPYHEGNKNEADRYKKMRNITYLFDKGKLYRRYFIDGHLEKEEILYAHFQKRRLKMESGVEDADKFVIVPNEIGLSKKMEYGVREWYSSSTFNINEIMIDLKKRLGIIIRRLYK